MRDRLSPPCASGENALDDGSENVGQTEVAALEPERQFGVVDAEQVQQRRLEVVDVDRVLGDVVTEVVRLTVARPRLDAAAGDPDREATAVVVAAVLLL